MIKELFKDNYKRYFQAEKFGKKIIFTVYEWDQDDIKPIEQINELFNNADIESYLKEKYTLESILNEDSLSNLFNLDIQSYDTTLAPKNYNLYEYEKLIQGIAEPPKALKSACICRDREGQYFYIACEPADSESALTRDNVKIIESHVSALVEDIEKKLNMNYSHTEIY